MAGFKETKTRQQAFQPRPGAAPTARQNWRIATWLRPLITASTVPHYCELKYIVSQDESRNSLLLKWDAIQVENFMDEIDNSGTHFTE